MSDGVQRFCSGKPGDGAAQGVAFGDDGRHGHGLSAG